MNRIDTSLPGVVCLEPRVFGDARGWFLETYSAAVFEEMGIRAVFVQDNHSYTARAGVLRGVHFQNEPMAQGKLVRVLRGAVLDVAVDLRLGSPAYLRWVAVELSADNKRQLFIPRGFGHAFLTLTEDVEFVYKVDNFYSPAHDRSVRFDDPAIGIDWGIQSPFLSDKDANAPLVRDSDCNFMYHP
jgi:dTDP-4-dehydrorhamnose 3,5-epimerase